MTNIKNQIKSFTASSVKKELINYFVFLGGISGSSQQLDETDISIVSRITKDETCVVVPRINWSSRDFTPYYVGSDGLNSYCYNDVSDIVYLCVGKAQPTGLISGQIPSTQEPSHSYGVQTYSDGYSWFALYRIDLGLSKFLSETVIPVSNLNDFTLENESGTYSTKYNSVCSGNPGLTGECYFYYTQKTKDPVGITVYEINDLVLGIGSSGWECSKCHEFGQSLGYKTKHIKYNSSSSEIERTPLITLDAQVSNLKLDINDRYYIHYKNYEYQTDLNKSITSLQLDVETLTIEDRIVQTQNPTVTILDALGDGATARIETYYDIPRNAFIANGITLLTAGSLYINPSFKVVGGTNNLSSAINAVILPEISDPSSFLPNPKVSVIKNIKKSELDNNFATNQTIFSKTGIIKNVLDTDGLNPTLTAQPNQSVNGRTTSKITLTPNYSSCPSCISGNPSLTLDDIYIESGITGTSNKIVIKTTNETANSSDYSSKIVSYTTSFSDSVIEISGVDELSFDLISTADIVEIDGSEFVVDSVSNPNYKLDQIEYITKRSLTNNVVFDNTTGTDSSIKLTFLI